MHCFRTLISHEHGWLGWLIFTYFPELPPCSIADIYIAFLFIALILVANTVVLWPSSTLWLQDDPSTALNASNVRKVDSFIFYVLGSLWGEWLTRTVFILCVCSCSCVT